MASAAGLVDDKVSASFIFVSLSLTTIQRAHCVLAQDGAQRAASNIVSRSLSLMASGLYLRTLRLLFIASINSIYDTFFSFSADKL
jgi:hypothetical protein